MDKETCYSLFQEVYSIFGKSIPSEKNPQFNVFIEDKTVKKIPNECLEYILDRFKALDSLPQNLIKAVSGIYNTYLIENPRKRNIAYCSSCGGNGFFDVFVKTSPKGEKTSWHHFVAFCPHCQPHRDGFHNWTMEQWTSHGYLVCPHDFPGGIREFEYQHGMRQRPAPSPVIQKTYEELLSYMAKNSTPDYPEEYADYSDVQNVRNANQQQEYIPW